MRSIDEVKKRMIELGAQKNQVESKTVQLVFMALQEDGLLERSLFDLEKELESEIRRYNNLCEDAKNIRTNAENEARMVKKEALEEVAILMEKNENMQMIADKLKEGLSKEYADRLYIAEYFKNNTKVDTPQNNTAYIYGLAMILSGQSGGENACKDTQS